MSVCLIDTTVFCCIVPVPGRDHHGPLVREQMVTLVRRRTSLILPLAAIIETGNHVARCRDGSARRSAASRFVSTVTQAIGGRAPFSPTPFFEPELMLRWLAEFPDCAMRGTGFADLSIIKEFEQQCRVHTRRHVFIWSLDHHLSSYDRPAPTLPPGR